MKYLVKRASLYSDDIQPCEGAVQSSYVYVDRRTCSTPDDLRGGTIEWLNTGKNHRLIDGKIARDMLSVGWFIEINSLRALMEFMTEHGDVIISQWCIGVPRILIYDDYVE